MSHFSVIVIGDDFEEQLAPYHEFECTGNDEYVQDLDVTDEVRARIEKDGLQEGLEWFGLEDRVVESEDEVDKSDPHKYGYAVVRDGKLIKAVNRTNPNKKWDWYVVGGRWTGYFPLKPGITPVLGRPGIFGAPAEVRTGDQVRLKDIDVERARREAEGEAATEFDHWQAIVSEHGRPESWASVRERVTDVDVARKEYNGQPAIKVFNASERFFLQCPVEVFGFDREVYLRRRRNNALVPFAVVKDGKWYEKGSMGWFGMVADEKDAEGWSAQFQRLLDDLPPDTMLTMVDCHI